MGSTVLVIRQYSHNKNKTFLNLKKGHVEMPPANTKRMQGTLLVSNVKNDKKPNTHILMHKFLILSNQLSRNEVHNHSTML